MLKRIAMFLIMNIAIIVVITIIFAILENIFGITLDLYGFNYLSIFIFSLMVGFTGAFISLFISKWSAKRLYNINILKIENKESFNTKEQIVWQIIEELSERNNIKMPEVGVYQDSTPNAFATGASKNNSLVAVSTGLLDIMNKDEIEGVLGHEMSHIFNGDMVTMTLILGILNTFVVFIARIITNLISSMLDEKLSGIAYFAINILLQILFGILASMIAMKFSRLREFKADKGSALLVGKNKMIAGLKVLKNTKNSIKKDDSNFACMGINNNTKKGFFSLLSSHPDIDERIKALENLSL